MEFKFGKYSLKVSNYKELLVLIIGGLIGYGIFSINTLLKDNTIFFKERFIAIEKDVDDLKTKLNKVEKTTNNNFAKLNEAAVEQGSTYYIEKAIFSDDEIVKAKNKSNVKKY